MKHDVFIEDNPLVRKAWDDWTLKYSELSHKTRQERMDLVSNYKWVFPKAKKTIDLESLFNGNINRNRREFKKWFYVVSDYMLSRIHLGDCSYFHFTEQFRKTFNRTKCTSRVFPQMVILALSITGYITEFGDWYSYQGDNSSHGYNYIIDRTRLYFDWNNMHKTETISFQETGIDRNRLSWKSYPDWASERQYESIKAVTVLNEGIKKSSDWMFNFTEYRKFCNLSEEDQEMMLDNWNSYQKLRDLSCGIVGRCMDDSDRPDGEGYAGRFYNTMTNMKSELRHKYIRLEGELVTEVDVCSAQPTFLGILIYKKTGVISEWLKKCLDGTFYEWIKEWTNTQEDRKTVKLWMMRYLYSCYQPNMKKDSKKTHRPGYEFRKTDDPYLCFQQRLSVYLKNNEPDIYDFIEDYKRNPVYRDDKTRYKGFIDEDGVKKKKKNGKGLWCSRLSYVLVQQEVEYIKNCIKALPEDMKFWTIHDCICVKESQSLEVQSIMEKVSQEMFGEGITLRLKRENTSR